MSRQRITRVGIIGTEAAHARHFLRFFNTDQRAPGWRVTAVVGSRTDLPILPEGSGVEFYTEVSELFDRVDAVLLCERDGRHHFAQAEPFLRNGVDVFINKPVAINAMEVEQLCEIAAQHGAVLEGGSALRYAPQVQQAARHSMSPRLIVVSGPADASSPYSGLHFYGSHHTELVSELLGNPAAPKMHTRLTSVSDEGRRTYVAAGEVGGCQVTMVFADPNALVSFGARVSFGEEQMVCETGPTAPLYAAQMEDFVSACTHRRAVNRGKLSTPVALLQQVVDQLT